MDEEEQLDFGDEFDFDDVAEEGFDLGEGQLYEDDEADEQQQEASADAGADEEQQDEQQQQEGGLVDSKHHFKRDCAA